MAASEEFLFVIRRFADVREEVEERSHRDPVPDILVDAVEPLVQRLLGVAVGAFKVGIVAAPQLASWGGATVIGTVRRRGDLDLVHPAAVMQAVALDESDPAEAIRALAPDGVDRIVEIDFSGNADLDAAVAKNQAVIVAYATRQDRPGFPFWPMLFDNITIRLLGSDDFPPAAKEQAAADLTTAARDGALHVTTDTLLPLEQTTRAHDRVDAGPRGRVLITVPG
jgi:NADPH:quinone reductase